MADNKNYIISITAQLKGDKVVISGLRNIEGEVKKFSKTVEAGTGSTKSWGDQIMLAGKRALMVAPVWMALRAGMQAVIGATQDAIQANMDFEESMAKNKTLLTGSTDEINSQMSAISETITNLAMGSRVSLKDVADSFYFLRTSSLTTEQSLSALPVVLDLMQGSMLTGQEAARALAGMYNTLGDSVKGASTDAEKFTKIGDQLAYVVANEDVLLGELIQGYSKMAPFVTTLDDSFGDTIATLGFLNTNLLRGARAGTLTAQAIVALSKEAQGLASEFGITFDPNKPMSFVKAVDSIKEAMGENSKLTGEQQAQFNRVFNVRASVPLRMLIAQYDTWKKALKGVEEDSVGFNKRISEIRTETTVAQMQRLANITAVLGGDFVQSAMGGVTFASMLRSVNDSLAKTREGAQFGGDIFGKLVASGGDFQKVLTSQMLSIANQLAQGKTIAQIIKGEKDRFNLLKKQADANKDLAKIEKEAETQKRTRLDVMKADQSSQASILKTIGANELEVARFRLMAVENIKSYLTEEDYNLQKLQAENGLLEAQVAIRRQISSEQANLSIQYANADKYEKAKINRMIELRNMSAKELADTVSIYRDDLDIFTKFQSSFSKEKIQAVGEALAKSSDMKTLDLPISDVTQESIDSIFKEEKIGSFWTTWTSEQTKALEQFSLAWDNFVMSKAYRPEIVSASQITQSNAQTEVTSFPHSTMADKPASQTNVSVSPNINIKWASGSIVEISKAVADVIYKFLTGDEEFQKNLGKKLSDKV